VRPLLLLAVLSVGLCVPSASAGTAATRPIKFTPYAFGYVRDGFLGAARPRNRILIGRTRAQTLRWDASIWHRYTAPPQAADFARQAVLGVFLVDRPNLAVQGVVVTSVAVTDGTLSLTLKVSPWPVNLRGPGVDSPIAVFQLPGAPSARYHAFTVVTVARAAVAHVRRVVVTQEVYDSDALVVDVPNLPFL
jgi:hypothetical protein